MGFSTGIAWTDHTWNPWMGCTKVSEGCRNCYAERDMLRYGRSFKVVRASRPTFAAPLKWSEPARVFTCSWSDFFHERADPFRDEAWEIIRRCPHLTFQILTKRPQNIAARLPATWGDGWLNVWLGATVEDGSTIWRMNELREIPAVLRFISYEPALGPVEWAAHLDGFSWLIAGGESGPKARPADVEWFRVARVACAARGIPFFFKQMGGKSRIGGHWGGDLLDGKRYAEIPEPGE